MSLPVYQNTIVNDRGDVLPEALLRVRTDPGQGNVTLYKDRDGFDALTNVGDVYADTEGFVRFYLPPGVYRMHVVASGYERTYRHVQVAPLNEYNVVAAEQYELAITDAGNNIQFISDNPVDVEIPTDEDVEFPMWSEITLIQAGDGIITLSGDVTIQNPSGGPVKSMGKGSSIHLTLIGGNVWLARVTFDRIIEGDIEQTGDLKITGTITHQGNSTQTGNSNQTGNAQITGRLDVDNLRLDGNTVSSTNSNGNVDITPAGSGKVRLNKSTDVDGDFEVSGDTVLHGNLHVKGTTTIIDSTEVDIGDNIIRLNANETGQPTLSAGFEVERGLQANVSFLWDEFHKRWTTSGQPLHISNLIATGSATIGDQTIVPGSIDNWNTAYSWGNHASAGYYSPDNVGTPGKNLLAATTQEAARQAIGAAAVGEGGGDITSSQITDSTAVGRAVLTAADEEAARQAIGLPNIQSATPEEGGLLVNNQKTGTGLERVLTESDLLDSGVGVDQVPLNGDLVGRFAWGKNFDSDPTPPRSPAEWPNTYISIASADGWGSHDVLYAKQILRIGGSYALLYQSRHNGFMTASLAFSTDLRTWHNSPLNPIFSEVTYPWQGERAMPEQLVYDEENHRWILIICGNGGAGVPGQGIRAIGAAYSEDLVNWTLEPNPIVLVEDADILLWAPGSPVDRVYCHGLIRKDGWWYMIVNAGGDVAGQRRYKTGVIRSQHITGPWEGIAANPVLEGTPGGWDEATTNLMSPIYYNGRWWAAYNSTGGAAARRTLGLAWTDDLTSKWEKSTAPIWQGADASADMDRPVLFPAEDGWGVIAGKRIVPGGNGELLMVYSQLAGEVLPGRATGGGVVTWTPVISNRDNTNPAVTDSATGYIVRNGDVVTLSFDIRLSSLGSATGDLHINGIPPGFEPLKPGHGTLNIGRIENINIPTDALQLSGWVTFFGGLTQIELRYITRDGESVFLDASNLTDTSRIFGSCTYISSPS